MTHRIGPWLAQLGITLAIISMAAGGLWAIHSQRTVNQRLCTQTVENRDAVRGTWLAAQEYILRTQSTEEARNKTKEFYAAVLVGIPPLECVDRKPVEVHE